MKPAEARHVHFEAEGRHAVSRAVALLGFAGALLAPLAARAATYYVSPSGSDTAAISRVNALI